MTLRDRDDDRAERTVATPHRRPTLSDVARLAQVSTATASRALSDPDKVSTATRQAVLLAAKRTGYRPNLLARSLRKQQAQAIVVLVPGLENPFFPEVILGMEGAARQRGYSLVLGLTRNDEAVESSYVQLVQNQRADGVLLLDGGLKHLVADGKEFGVPVVQVLERLPGVNLPWVGIDDQGAALLATRHLIELGHRRIGHISGFARYFVTPARLAGYRAGLTAAGIATDVKLIATGSFTAEGGQCAARKLMALARPPTALFCANDDSALGAMRHLRSIGARVPQDISVIGIDDISQAAYGEPPLTTVRQPRYEIGSTAIAMLLQMIEGRDVRPADVTLPVDLVLRASTARVPGRVR